MKKLLLTLCLFSILYLPIRSQNPVEPWKLGHWLSKEEMTKKLDNSLSFVETLPPTAPIRNIAEFDQMQGVLVRYPFGIPITLIKEMAKDCEVTTIVATTGQKTTVLQQYVSNGVDTSHCNFLIAPSDSYWTRDYGPWFESDSSNHIGIVDFPYNRPRANDDEIPKKVADMMGIPWYGMNLIHTGGNYMTDGLGISSSTDLVWTENPTLTHDQVAQKVNDYLGINPYLVEPDPNGTYIDHIDCWGKFLAPDKILIRKVLPSHPQYSQIEATANFYANTPCSYGYNYRVFRVMTPQDQPYSNSLILNNKVFVPFMGTTWDDSARVAYQNAMPGYTIIGMIGNPSTPWVSTDALHCRAMGLADVGQLYIKHLPLFGNQPAQDNFLISADIIQCNTSPLYNDSILIHYKIGNGTYHSIRMNHITGTHFTGYIPKQPNGTVIKYYLTAADHSGHRATLPIQGPLDPFAFTALYTDLTAIPDTLRFETYDDCFNGKYTAIQNFTPSLINLLTLEEMGFFTPGPTAWRVLPYPVSSFPYTVNPGDSLRFRVIIDIPTSMYMQGYWIDTLHFTSAMGTHNVIILLNSSLVFGGINDQAINNQSIQINAFPNPSRDFVNFSISLMEPQHVQIEILDFNGKVIKRLMDQQLPSGIRKVTWDLISEDGAKVPGGVYLYRLKTDRETHTGKIVVD